MLSGATRRQSGETQRRQLRRKLVVATTVLAIAIAGAFLVMCPGRVHGATVQPPLHDLTGTWVLNATKSDFGGVQGPTSDTAVVTRDGFVYHFRQTVTQGDSSAKIYTDWPTDSGDVTNTLPTGMSMKIKAHKEGAVQVALVEMSQPTPQGIQTASETVRQTLSADGKTLTRQMTIVPQAGEPVNIRLVYDKRPN